jgi:hypothetical protein
LAEQNGPWVFAADGRVSIATSELHDRAQARSGRRATGDRAGPRP